MGVLSGGSRWKVPVERFGEDPGGDPAGTGPTVEEFLTEQKRDIKK